MDKKVPIFDYVKPEENSGYLLWQVTMQWQLNMNRSLGKIGLTLTQFSLLAGLYWLTENKELVTQQRLADYANTDKMMTSKVLLTLEGKKVLSRADHPKDSRAKQLLITDQGVAVLREAYELVKQVDSIYFEPIVDDKAVFDELLKKIIK